MSTNMYASRKRKKPQRSVKPPPEGAKSNPSKRHRERLNGELDRLASLLPYPQDVISKLDKLTILRLCVSYLRAKSFFNVTLKSTASQRPESNVLKKQGSELQVPEGELLLQVLNGFALVVTAGGTIFYASSTIQDYLGFHQSDVVHQSVYDVIHTEDRAELQRQLHWALNPTLTTDTGQLVSDSASPQAVTVYNPEALPPENSTFLERNFVCRLRCLLDNSTGFLALNIQGRLKFLHGQSERTKEGKAIPPQLALFALASPLQTPTILEIRTKNFIFKTKHKLDFTPTACDAKGKIVLGYTEAELCNRGSGYQFIHAADMLHCAENHMRMIKTGESGMTVFRLLTKLTGWVWVQANARLVYKNGRPECIIASQRVLTDEEGEDTLRKRSLQLPFSYTTGEALLYDTSFPKTLVTGDSLAGDTTCPTENTTNNNQDVTLDPDSLLGSLLKQEKSIYYCSPQTQNQHQLQEEVAGLPQEECEGIFSSSHTQEGSIPSLSETVLFKQEPLGVGGGGGIDGFSSEDRDRDLWSFMRNLGNSREDLELFQQDEMFLDVDLDAGRDGLLPDLTDEILSYVQESLRKRSDWDQTVFSCRGAKLGDQDYSCPTTLLHQPSMEQPLATHPHSTTVLLHQPSMEQPLTPHPHSTTVLLHQPSVKQPLTPHPHSTTVLLHQPSMEQPLTPHPHSTTVLLHQPSMEQPLTPHPHSTTVPQWPPQLPVVHPLSVHHYQPPPHPQQPIPQQCLHTQPRPQEALQATQQQHRLSQPPQRQQQSHLNGQVLPNQQRQNNQLYSQSQPFHPQQRQQQLCNRLKHMQVDGTGTGSMTERQKDITKQQQQIPPLFNVEQPGGLQTHHSHPQHGHLCLGEASLGLGLHYMNQLNIVSVSRSPELSSYVPTTGLQSQRVDGELLPQDLEELLGSLESTGPRGIEDGRGAHQWSVVEALGVFQQQGHLPDGQAQSQATSTGCAQHAYPLAVGFSRVNRAERPFTAQSASPVKQPKRKERGQQHRRNKHPSYKPKTLILAYCLRALRLTDNGTTNRSSSCGH
ncbi:aryl hydrocarbon receptor isoform X2 [Coregonus clupeaformis]|uniref:aryl hydrocarbon receptor isoform X2 n=1 Tax=Coregonus clupeaformis TaxID=59861 RepID=UPI001BE0BBE6|nr:aryl hydrocarbon receptor isoform X2 [Coregonus clupeaformis]